MDKRQRFWALAKDQRGATAVEYGLICAMIILAMVVALKGVASENTRQWNHVSSEFSNSSRQASQ